MEINKNILAENWGYFRENEIVTGSSLDDVTNDVLGDYWFFMTEILDREANNRFYFTQTWDRDVGLPLLFRQSYNNYLSSGAPCAYADFLPDWLSECERQYNQINKDVSQWEETTECCPYCSNEITMQVKRTQKLIKFCPHCGKPNIWLCNKCMEVYGDCNNRHGFCKNKQEGEQ